jgi:hypothetical protein
LQRLNSKLGRTSLLFQAAVSFFGLALVVLLAVNPQVSQEAFAWRKPLVGSAFAAVCVLGMVAALFPGRCSEVFVGITKGKSRGSQVSHATASSLRGHHPECSQYSGHVLTITRKVFCATCSGLFLGAFIALAGVGTYFFGNWKIGQNTLLALSVGVVGVALGLLQSSLPIRRGTMRLFTGAFFVAGAFLILSGIEELTHNVSIDFLVVALSIFWLMTKISFSKLDHTRICLRCTSETCDFKADSVKKEG